MQCMQVAWDNVPETLAPCTMVVGVAEDVAQQGITDEARFLYYLNADQMSAFFNARRFIVRMPGARIEADVERVRRAMQAAMPGDGFVVVRPLQEIVDDNRRSWRLGATLFVAFGGLALAVAAIGLYGAIGYGVTQRMHELAMRTALGAQRGHIMGLVMLQGLRVGAAVVVLGLVIAAAAAPFIEPLLYKESPHDPVVFVSVGALMMLVALVAGLPPARRALTADPNRVLRSD